MCGIAGFVERQDSPRGPRADRVAAMCHAIRHRGPDDGGQYLDERAALGMRRLSIIDLSTGHQPMANEDGSLWVVFNGEIYNYKALAAELTGLGHRLRTASDTEVIVHAWEQWGESALTRLHGMFAFALWDARERTLWLARDRPGIKPLHYAELDGGIRFASEIKSFLVDPAFPRTLDLHSLDHYCSFLYTPGDRSIFASVRKLPPGHVLRWRDGTSTVRRYWSLPPGGTFRGSEREAVQALRASLASAVRSHLVSDVPLGAFLSGGIDSSAVVALMAQASSAPVRTFSIGFDDEAHDELAYARLVAERFATDHHEFVVRPDALAILDRLIAHFDEPFGDSSAIPTWYVSEIARRHVTVVLSGDGGDELFGGYERYLPHRRIETFDRLRIPAKRQLASLAWRAWPRRARGRNFLRHVTRDAEGRYLDAIGFFRPDEKAELYSGDLVAAVSGGTTAEALAAGAFDDDRGLSWPERMMRFDFRTYLPEDVLTKIDRMSMAHSIESRVPLLDTGVVELAASLPSALKIMDGRQKHVLKEAVSDLLPRSILDRPKHGFGVPVGAWFRGRALGDLVTDALLSRRATTRGLFDPREVKRLVDEHRHGRRDHTLRLWLLVVLELWQRQYVDEAVEAHAA
jgi:asparagine synthase (glutamine-hydrolysing)